VSSLGPQPSDWKSSGIARRLAETFERTAKAMTTSAQLAARHARRDGEQGRPGAQAKELRAAHRARQAARAARDAARLMRERAGDSEPR
jgi:hypothetical protein